MRERALRLKTSASRQSSDRKVYTSRATRERKREKQRKNERKRECERERLFWGLGLREETQGEWRQ
jgi:hypothetical protein